MTIELFEPLPTPKTPYDRKIRCLAEAALGVMIRSGFAPETALGKKVVIGRCEEQFRRVVTRKKGV